MTCSTYLRQNKLRVELVDGLDVGEHLDQGVLRKHLGDPVLLIDPEVEFLERKIEKYSVWEQSRIRESARTS